MLKNLEIFQMAHGMAKHAGARQTVIAQNMANADTPGFVAKDITSFETTYSGTSYAANQKATRTTHLHGFIEGQPFVANERRNQSADPNGNTVSIETEMLHAVDTKRQHDRAMMIYKSALTILRTTVSR